MWNLETAKSRFSALVADALAKGAELVAGGEARVGAGNYFDPSLIANVPDDADVMQIEPFGPLALTRSFGDMDEAIALANATPFGLAAFAFTENGRRANLVADALDAGMVGVNSFTISGADTPFGGVKHSGFGSEGGPEGLANYCVTKAVHLA